MMTAFGIIGLLVLEIIICFFVFVFGVMLGIMLVTQKLMKKQKQTINTFQKNQKKLIEVLKSQNVAYKKMFEESCDVEVTKDEEN